MPLKHDVAGMPVPAADDDPCAVREPVGPLAMRLKGEGPLAARAKNPLCMRIK
jgi:hypothetical protein